MKPGTAWLISEYKKGGEKMVTGVGSGYNGLTQAMSSSQMMGKDAFLQLLVTELRYQDPLDP
ncbi:MAG TPA: hypothetical protein DDZ55_08600, partial [Firmicutes bacterium]|nr:hypothetical protein [Bacillota bacterium]